MPLVVGRRVGRQFCPWGRLISCSLAGVIPGRGVGGWPFRWLVSLVASSVHRVAGSVSGGRLVNSPRELVQVAGERTGLVGCLPLPGRERFRVAACFRLALDVSLPGDEFGDSTQKEPHVLFRVGEVAIAAALLQEHEQPAKLIDRSGLTRAGLEKLTLLEQQHDPSEPISNLLLTGPVKRVAKHGRPPRVGGG